MDLLEQVDDLRLNGHVQCGHRLVTDNELGIQRQSTGNADTLPLAAGELMVKDLPYSEPVKAYIACNLELENALTYLMQRLEQAGVADKTCIVLTNDHYPYGLTEDEYNELAGREMDLTFEKYRNSFICYVPGLSENIVVDEYCSTADILPTLLNLFGVDYDSRLLAGTDALSNGVHIAVLSPVDFDQLRREVEQFHEGPEKKDLISYAMYPKVYEDFCRHRKEYGYITRMGSHVFFNGMALGETNKINIEDGKTLVIKYLGLGDHNSDGTINVQFELNGMRREVTVRDPNASEQTRQATLADESDPMQVGSSIPGMVSKVCVKQGDHVEKDQVLAIIEAMKMETAITARTAGTVQAIRIKEGQPVKARELLMTLA